MPTCKARVFKTSGNPGSHSNFQSLRQLLAAWLSSPAHSVSTQTTLKPTRQAKQIAELWGTQEKAPKIWKSLCSQVTDLGVSRRDAVTETSNNCRCLPCRQALVQRRPLSRSPQVTLAARATPRVRVKVAASSARTSRRPKLGTRVATRAAPNAITTNNKSLRIRQAAATLK